MPKVRIITSQSTVLALYGTQTIYECTSTKTSNFQIASFFQLKIINFLIYYYDELDAELKYLIEERDIVLTEITLKPQIDQMFNE